ncbi:MAG: ribosome-associated heat shock protein Hsp15 [Paraglaciecola sp.]|jgi:ribosome-associated heat shock protein Hsp15
MNNKQKHTVKLISIRLDKWLWAARLFKTRSIARDAVQSGKIQYNGQRSKPGKIVELGACIKVPQGFDSKEITVLELNEHRRAAPLAQLMYEETETSQSLRQGNIEARKLSAFHSPKPDHRPNKKQRRQIIQLKHQ